MTLPPDPYTDDPWSWAFVVFRHIPGFPGYGVDTDGNVWSCRLVGRLGGIGDEWHTLSQGVVGPYCYRNVGFRRQGKTYSRYVHRVALEAFVGPCPEGMEALHRDCDTGNNSLRNLRWGTSTENSGDSVRLGRHCHGETTHNAILKSEDIPSIFEMRRSGMKHQDIANRYGVHHVTITNVLTRKTWKHVPVPAPLIGA